MLETINIDTTYRKPRVTAVIDGKFKEVDTDEILEERINDIISIVENVRTPEEETKARVAEQLASALPPSELVKFIDMMLEFKVGEFVKAGAIRKYKNRLYKATKEHRTKRGENPHDSDRWERVDKDEKPKKYVKPLDIDNIYQIGDKVLFGVPEKTYICVSPTMHSPEEFPASWEEEKE